MSLASLADEFEAVAAEMHDRLAAAVVCERVISHPTTPPKLAARVWLLHRWLGDFPLTGGRP